MHGNNAFHFLFLAFLCFSWIEDKKRRRLHEFQYKFTYIFFQAMEFHCNKSHFMQFSALNGDAYSHKLAAHDATNNFSHFFSLSRHSEFVCHSVVVQHYSVHSTVHNCDKIQRRFTANLHIWPNILRIFWLMINEWVRMQQQSSFDAFRYVFGSLRHSFGNKPLKKSLNWWNGIPFSVEFSISMQLKWFASLQWKSVSASRVKAFLQNYSQFFNFVAFVGSANRIALILTFIEHLWILIDSN